MYRRYIYNNPDGFFRNNNNKKTYNNKNTYNNNTYNHTINNNINQMEQILHHGRGEIKLCNQKAVMGCLHPYGRDHEVGTVRGL